MRGKRMFAVLSVLVVLLIGGSAVGVAQEPLVAKGVIKWVNKSAKNPILADWKGDLTFNDAAKKLVFTSGKQSFDAGYDNVRRILFEQGTHQRPRKSLIKEISEMQKQFNGDYWMYVEYVVPGKPAAKDMLQVPEQSAAQVLDKARQVFGDRVATADVRVGARFDSKALKDLTSKHTFEFAEWKNHPTPEVKPGKALMVVVCPVYRAYDDASLIRLKLKTHRAGEFGALQVKIHANDNVVLVNQVGTYGFAYLDAGDYQISSQCKNDVSALQVTMEAGKAYYFLQDWLSETVQLSQHSPELVMHKLSETPLGVWTRKSK
jgi:hypothetical protein